MNFHTQNAQHKHWVWSKQNAYQHRLGSIFQNKSLYPIFSPLRNWNVSKVAVTPPSDAMYVNNKEKGQWSIYKFRSMRPGTPKAFNLWVPNLFSESSTNIGESSPKREIVLPVTFKVLTFLTSVVQHPWVLEMCTSLFAAPANSTLCQCSGTSQPKSCTYRGGVRLQVMPLMGWAEPGHGIVHRLESPSCWKQQ